MLLVEPVRHCRRERSLSVQVGQHARSTFHAIPDFNFEGRGGVQQNIHARAEFDQANALSAFHSIADLLGEDDPARQKTGNLLEDHGLAIAFDGHHILLVLLGRRRIHGVDELSPCDIGPRE